MHHSFFTHSFILQLSGLMYRLECSIISTNLLIKHDRIAWQPLLLFLVPGVAHSSNGVDWQRGPLLPPSVSEQTGEVPILAPSQDWWAFDNGHVAIGDVQVGRS